MTPMIAQTTTTLLPPFSAGLLAALLGGIVVASLALAWLLGPANPVARRGTLWLLRGAILAIVVLILFNPVRVDRLPGPVQRPEVFYLVDASSSMQMGNPRSRWEDMLAIIRKAQGLAESSPATVKPFRFGQRLAAVEQPAQIGLAGGVPVADARPPAAGKALPAEGASPSDKPISPSEADTRLQAALKQISSRFGRVPPQAIVVFSDGRVHDESGLDQIAAEFKRLKVPVHVAPVGDMAKGGDAAIAAVVAPPRVRKFTEVEVQVFLRSFGYDGKRCEVVLEEMGSDSRAVRKLASLPVTLQSGFQSVSLPFRTDLSTRNLRISLPALPDEVSNDNNVVDAEMAIDRTKIRVLYIEGSAQPVTTVRVGDRNQFRGPFTDLKQALSDDEDIECVVLAAPGGYGRPTRITEFAQADSVRGFPTTIAELAAFDAILLSDVSSEVFTETQLGWIAEWVGNRGGGLCMVGGEHSFASGGWDQTPLAAMLPVDMVPGGADWVPGETLRVSAEMPPSPHPLWVIVADDKQNRQIVDGFPSISGVNRWAGARASLATVLASTTVSGVPIAPSDNALSSVSNSFVVDDLVSAAPEAVGAERAKPAAAGPAKGDANAAAGPGNRMPAIVAGRFGRGRTMALAFPITSPAAEDFVHKWGAGDNRYYGKFCRNLVYWLTENSSIGRRRLVATADKRFYRPGETIAVQAATYDESSAPTRNYRVVAMVEPLASAGDESDNSPVRWPAGLARVSGEEGPYLFWGEEFDLPPAGQDQPLHAIQLPLADAMASSASSQSLRLELTAYEDVTQVDSTSLDIQVLHDPFEQQNPFPNHKLLERVAAQSGGQVLRSAEDLAGVLRDVPVNVGPPVVKRSPMWSNWWLLGTLLGLLTVEWCWRRRLGLA